MTSKLNLSKPAEVWKARDGTLCRSPGLRSEVLSPGSRRGARRLVLAGAPAPSHQVTPACASSRLWAAVHQAVRVVGGESRTKASGPGR